MRGLSPELAGDLSGLLPGRGSEGEVAHRSVQELVDGGGASSGGFRDIRDLPGLVAPAPPWKRRRDLCPRLVCIDLAYWAGSDAMILWSARCAAERRLSNWAGWRFRL